MNSIAIHSHRGFLRTTYRADGSVESTTLLHGVTEENAAKLGVIDGHTEYFPEGRYQVTHQIPKQQGEFQ